MTSEADTLTAERKVAAKRSISKVKRTSKKVKFTTAKKAKSAKISRKTTTKTAKKYRRRLVIPKSLNIYRIHPLRKFMEISVYSCIMGYKALDVPESKRSTKPIKIMAKELKKAIKTKAEAIAIKRHISDEISNYFHPDQKIVLWDYLENQGLPTTINLKYNYLDGIIWNIIATPQQRKMIEGYRMLGRDAYEIWKELQAVPLFVEITGEQIEHYLYFMWNFDVEKFTRPYPIQMLANKLLNIKNNVTSEFYIDYELQKIQSLPRGDPEKEQFKSKEDLRMQLVGRPPIYIKTPFLRTDTENEYVPWGAIAPADPRNAPERLLVPMDSYDLPIRISTHTATVEDLELSIQIVNNRELTIRDRMERISERLAIRAESLINAQQYDNFSEFMRRAVLPTAQSISMWGININFGNKSSITAREKVKEGSHADYKDTDEIEVYGDREKRRNKLIGKVRVGSKKKINQKNEVR